MAKRYNEEFKLHDVKQITELNKPATQVVIGLGNITFLIGVVMIH